MIIDMHPDATTVRPAGATAAVVAAARHSRGMTQDEPAGLCVGNRLQLPREERG
jgi:hypothetical protein